MWSIYSGGMWSDCPAFVVNPVASMQAIANPSLGNIALEVTNKLKNVIDNLGQ